MKWIVSPAQVLVLLAVMLSDTFKLEEMVNLIELLVSESMAGQRTEEINVHVMLS